MSLFINYKSFVLIVIYKGISGGFTFVGENRLTIPLLITIQNINETKDQNHLYEFFYKLNRSFPRYVLCFKRSVGVPLRTKDLTRGRSINIYKKIVYTIFFYSF